MSDDPVNDAVRTAKYCMDNDPFARQLGTEVVEIRPGYAKARLKMNDNLLNFVKIPHGAVVFAVADQAFAAAANSRGTVAVALNVSITFLAAACPDATLVAEAEEISCGRRTASYQIRVRDEEGKTIATFQGLVYRKDTPLEKLAKKEQPCE